MTQHQDRAPPSTEQRSTSSPAMPWVNRSGYGQGVFWIILVAITSNLNDILMRLLGSRLPAMEITFFRFLFATLALLPVMIYHGKQAFYTQRPFLHLMRSLLLFGAIGCWVTGLKMVPLVVVSTLALTTNLFVLPMAVVFLNEHVGWQRTIATIIGFIGMMVIVFGETENAYILKSLLSFDNGTLYLVAAAMMFALSDIINKKFVVRESTLSMMFYIAVGTTVCGAYPAYSVWLSPTTIEYALLAFLGIGGNLILYFLLKAFAATDVSALTPFRYTELFVATFTGFIIWHEIPSLWNLVGAAIIIPSTFAIAYYETHQKKQAIVRN